MNRIITIFLLLLALHAPACQAQQEVSQTSLPPIQVYFSPKGGGTEAVVRELNAAKTSVLVQACSFTSAPITKALLAAHKRDVKVQVSHALAVQHRTFPKPGAKYDRRKT